jgi:D-glycero-D-manno-heptose 1,7-bisphosphate phosphatase
MTENRRAVFLDRDGTLNKEVNYLHRTENFEWVEGAPEAVKRLNTLGVCVIVVTNQAGVAHGYFEEKDVENMHTHMREELKKYGAEIDSFYYCPFHPDGEVKEYRKKSKFRKPGVGMYQQAIEEWSVNPNESFVVGDKNSDLIPGGELGMDAIKVKTGHDEDSDEKIAKHTVQNVLEAVRLVERKIGI